MLKKRIFIGRNEDNDIVVPAVFNVVSGSHADLKLLDSGEYLFSDHSTNGSTVKGKNIRNEAVTVSFGTPIILATRYALDWELVRELLPPVAAEPAPTVPKVSAPTVGANDWHPGHPADFTSVAPKGAQAAYDRSSHIDFLSSKADPVPPRVDPRETRMSSEPPMPPRGGNRDTYVDGSLEIATQELRFMPGDMFDGRFLLVRNIGAGASATVWEAKDTKTGGMKVAIKIFALKHGMDSYGFQNLQREFTTVFNFTQQYLLTPSFYDVCEGRPYLVMRYCERGSAANLIGRASEADVIKLLHDVASGLEYLHEKQIIHQDIKPDNILIADNGDFMITDFGISATIDALNGSKEMSGGTRAYMGPERFNGQNSSASDIWSLGATAYELVTGDAPYGDNGGMMQAYGTGVAPIAQRLQPEVKDIIMSCLEKDPAKRPTAAEIRKKIDIYYETGGSWTRKNKAKTILIIAAAATLALLMAAGIWIWDYNRVKTYYYGAVTEVYGVPQGVGKEVKHGKRNTSFMIQKQRGKVIRMANVNSAGKVVPYNDTEYSLRYYPDMHYEYGDDGSLTLKKLYNEHGKPLFSMSMDINKEKGTGTAVFYRFDETKTEMLMPLNLNQNIKDFNLDFNVKYSAISKYGYKYDKDGHVKELRYYGFGSRPAADQYGIGGIKYKYDDRGLISQQQYINVDGKPTFDSNGLSIKEFEYDDNGNMAEERMLNVNKGPSHNGTHCAVFKYEYDEYGNVTSAHSYTLNGKPAVRTDLGCYSCTFEYDDHGHRVAVSLHDKKGKLVENKVGVAITEYEYNDDGFQTGESYFDAKKHPFKAHGNNHSKMTIEVGPTGLPTEVRYYDEKGKPFENQEGMFMMKMEYDGNGNLLTLRAFDKNKKPMNFKGLFHKSVFEYDENNNVVKRTLYDKNDKRTTFDGIVSQERYKYNPWGAMTEVRFYNTKDKPTRGANLTGGVKWEYSAETGFQTKEIQIDADGKTPTIFISDVGLNAENNNKYAICEVDYDRNGHIKTLTYKDPKGKELYTMHFESDGRGNLTKKYKTINGKLDGYVENNKYDENNNLITTWATNLSGQPMTMQGQCHKMKMEYDEMGNYTQATYWGTRGQAVTDFDGIHKKVFVYDRFGQNVEIYMSDISGRPINGISVKKSVFDVDGNEIETGWYGKDGKLASTPFLFSLVKMDYDKHGNNVSTQFFDKNKRPVDYNGFQKVEGTYDDSGNLLKRKYYTRSGYFGMEVNKYNDKGRIKEQYAVDANNRLTGGGKYVYEYQSDGVTPTKVKFYDLSNRMIGYLSWDDKVKAWDTAHPHVR